MWHTQTPKSSPHNPTSRPFFQKGIQNQESKPFFPTQSASPKITVQLSQLKPQIQLSPAEKLQKNGYTTYLVPIPGNQKFIIQFRRNPDATEGALLRFKGNKDPHQPGETPIPAGTSFSPTLLEETDQFISFSFDGGNQVDLAIRLASGLHTEHHDAINPDEPYGPLRVDQTFQRRYIEAILAHPGGSEQYSWTEPLPDEAIAPPVWQPYSHGGRIPGYIAVRGNYAKRPILFGVDIHESQRGALRGFEAGMLASVKFMGSLAIYSIPYVGAVVIVGEALAGSTIWGDKLSTEARVAFGLLALISVAVPLVRAAAGSRAEMNAAAELAASKGISKPEALTLIRGAKAFTPEEQAFVRSATQKLNSGKALSASEASQLATLLNKVGTQDRLIFSAADDIQSIWKSQRYWGQTEGAVYGARMPVTTLGQRLKAMIGPKEGLVVFQGQAANLFNAHKVEGGYSAMKRLLGQHKAGFGDIIFENAVKGGNTIIVTEARLATAADIQHAGQTTSWALARLWGRRLTLEPVFTGTIASGGGISIYMAYDWVSDQSQASTSQGSGNQAPNPTAEQSNRQVLETNRNKQKNAQAAIYLPNVFNDETYTWYVKIGDDARAFAVQIAKNEKNKNNYHIRFVSLKRAYENPDVSERTMVLPVPTTASIEPLLTQRSLAGASKKILSIKLNSSNGENPDITVAIAIESHRIYLYSQVGETSIKLDFLKAI